jgi:hypothetical protein
VKKVYLLAGSLGLLGAMSLIAPATAADPLGAPQAAVETNASALSAPVTAKAENPELLALEPKPSEPTTSTLVAQAAPASQDQLPAEDNSLAQVTSVSELSDVQPTDWAFQAVQSLVERYACIEGYPDRTFRGNRAATRYELAAALNACLNQISAQLGGLTAEDLATIKRLQDEFAAELATLRGRVDALEARTTELEANQFSTTTKLQGEVVLAPQYGQGGDGGDARATFLNRVRLNFNTSFTGSDLLNTQLELSSGADDFINAAVPNDAANFVLGEDAAGFPDEDFPNNFIPGVSGFIPGVSDAPGTADFTEFVDPGAADYSQGNATCTTACLRRLAYTFNPVDNLAITFGPRLFPSDFVDLNSYANLSSQDFSSGFFVNNPLIINNVVDTAGGAGAALDWNFGGGPITLRAVYVAASPTNALANTFGGGLFGSPYQATGELEFSPIDDFAIRAQFTTASVFDVQYTVYGANAEFTFADRIGIFGRYGNGQLDGFGARGDVDVNPQTFMAGIGIRDLFLPGSLLAFAYGQPFIEDTVGDATQANYEAFYKFQVSDNISVTPAVIVITDANNNSDSDTIYEGILRTTFSF